MDQQRLAAMAETTRLTRAGRLTEATELIQRTLLGAAAGTSYGIKPTNSRPADSGTSRPQAGDAVPVVPGQRGKVMRAQGTRAGSGASDALKRLLPLPALPKPRSLGLRDIRNLSGLASGRSGRAPASPIGPALPGEIRCRSYRGPAGERPYTSYVPSGCTGEPVALIVMLHGGRQSAADFAAATRMNELAEEHGFLVVYPEQITSANPGRYWNWFQPAHQHRGSGEPSLILGITEQILAEHPADPNRVYVAGFSAGAAMAAVMGASHPDVYAAVGVHSGLAHQAAHDIASAFAAMQQGPQRVTPLTRAVPVITFHGSVDTVVSPVNATRIVEQFVPARVAPRSTTTIGRTPEGRSYSRSEIRSGSRTLAEQWTVHGSGHAWSGGATGGSYTDPQGPHASAEMVRFFVEHPRNG